MQKTILNVLTHGGMWHADDMLALATLNLFFDVKIKRTNKVTQTLDEWASMIIDIGMKYDAKKYFDHHQDAELDASCCLILDWLEGRGFIPEQIADSMRVNLFNIVSSIDKGEVKASPDSFNRMISNCQDANEAVNMAFDVVRNLYNTCMKSLQTKSLWSQLTIENQVAINTTDKILLDWRSYAVKDNVLLLITKSDRGGYNLITRDNSLTPIQASVMQTYLHPTRYMANYATLEDAIDAAHVTISHFEQKLLNSQTN